MLRSEVVGGYRHKRYERCYHGIIGFVLLEKLNEGQGISFLKRDSVPDGSIHRTEIPIFHYKYDAANKAFKRARELASVDNWLKSTHMRFVHVLYVLHSILFFCKILRLTSYWPPLEKLVVFSAPHKD